jgi:hypothetical protein
VVVSVAAAAAAAADRRKRFMPDMIVESAAHGCGAGLQPCEAFR